MRVKRNPYHVMGLPVTATAEEIQKTFRKLAVQYHPDKNPGDAEAEEKFKELNAAYEILSDPVKRADYHKGKNKVTVAPQQSGKSSEVEQREEYWNGLAEKVQRAHKRYEHAVNSSYIKVTLENARTSYRVKRGELSYLFNFHVRNTPQKQALCTLKGFLSEEYQECTKYEIAEEVDLVLKDIKDYLKPAWQRRPARGAGAYNNAMSLLRKLGEEVRRVEQSLVALRP